MDKTDNSSNKTTLPIVNVAILLIVLVLTIAVMFYSFAILDKGFEITDESYYVLLAMYARSQNLYISAQHWITGWFWEWTHGLFMFRALGVLCLVTSSLVLAEGSFTVCKRSGIKESKYFRIVVYCCSIIGALFYASTLNFSPCYNLLASTGAYAASGFVLIATQQSRIKKKHFFYFIAGCAAAIEFINKPSAGIATTLLLLLWAYTLEDSRSEIVKYLLSLMLGFCLCFATILKLNTNFTEAYRAFEEGLLVFRMVQSEPIGARLTRYVLEFSQNIWTSLSIFWLPTLFILIYRVTKYKVAAILSICFIVYTMLVGGYFNSGWTDGLKYEPPFALVAMMLMTLFSVCPVQFKQSKTKFLFIGLLLLPYTVAVGTGNDLFTQIVLTLAPWGVFMGVLISTHDSIPFRRLINLSIPLCFIATLSIQLVASGLKPYHLATSLFDQNIKEDINGLGSIRTDNGTHKFFDSIESAKIECSIASSSYFIGLYNLPGIALALQSIPLWTPWINNKEQAEYVINHAKLENGPLIIALRGVNLDTPKSLPTKLFGFPEDYRYCGSALYPFGGAPIEIWYKN